MLTGFKNFILRGNVIDLAVGVAIGSAFTLVVTQFTASFITPLVKVVSGGGVDAGTFTINDVVFDYAAFLNALLAFVITAAAIYFVVVVPVNALRDRRAKGDEEVEPTNEERIIELLEQIASK